MMMMSITLTKQIQFFVCLSFFVSVSLITFIYFPEL